MASSAQRRPALADLKFCKKGSSSIGKATCKSVHNTCPQ